MNTYRIVATDGILLGDLAAHFLSGGLNFRFAMGESARAAAWEQFTEVVLLENTFMITIMTIRISPNDWLTSQKMNPQISTVEVCIINMSSTSDYSYK